MNTKEKRLQLNEEHGNNNTVKNHKEDKNMRKTRKNEVTLIASFVVLLALMAACGKNETVSNVGNETLQQNVTQVSENAGETIGENVSQAIIQISENNGVVEDENLHQTIMRAAGNMGEAVGNTVKDVTEGIASTDEATDETSDATFNGNVVGGLDFTEFRNGDAPLEKIMADATYDSPKLIVMDFTVGRKVECILSNGRHRELKDDMPEGLRKFYEFAIYVPKRAIEIKTITPTDIIKDPRETIKYDENGNPYDDVLFWFELPSESIESEFEASFQIYYEDGTEDTFTVYLTKNFVTGD